MPSRHHRSTSSVPPPDRAEAEHTPSGIQLYTPRQAAQRLAVTESWIRRKAGTRRIPCTFVGKYLRFSDDNLHDIARDGHRAPRRAHRN